MISTLFKTRNELREKSMLTLFVSFVLLFASCTKDELPVIETSAPPILVKEEEKPADQNIVTVEVTFNSTPANPGASIAPLKYNKTSVLNLEFDDNPADAYQVFQYMKTKTFTDGTGKPKNFTASCAVNSRGNYNNGNFWEGYSGLMTKSQAIEMIAGGWTMANHGYYHSIFNSNDNFGYGKPVADNISDNTKTVLEKTGFKMRTLVVPANDQGYLAAAYDQGLIVTSSQNSFTGFQSYPSWGDFVSISTIPNNRVHLRRDFNDQWNTDGVNSIKNKLSSLFAKSSPGERMLYRLGTHQPNLTAFKTLMDYVGENSKDNCWVTTAQEMVEYFQIRDKVVKKESVVNGKLVITLDFSGIDKETAFKDLTLLINSNTSIQNIKVTNAASSSSSNENKLVNINF
jgi:hypothetical protein